MAQIIQPYTVDARGGKQQGFDAPQLLQMGVGIWQAIQNQKLAKQQIAIDQENLQLKKDEFALKKETEQKREGLKGKLDQNLEETRATSAKGRPVTDQEAYSLVQDELFGGTKKAKAQPDEGMTEIVLDAETGETREIPVTLDQNGQEIKDFSPNYTMSQEAIDMHKEAWIDNLVVYDEQSYAAKVLKDSIIEDENNARALISQSPEYFAKVGQLTEERNHILLQLATVDGMPNKELLEYLTRSYQSIETQINIEAISGGVFPELVKDLSAYNLGVHQAYETLIKKNPDHREPGEQAFLETAKPIYDQVNKALSTKQGAILFHNAQSNPTFAQSITNSMNTNLNNIHDALKKLQAEATLKNTEAGTALIKAQTESIYTNDYLKDLSTRANISLSEAQLALTREGFEFEKTVTSTKLNLDTANFIKDNGIQLIGLNENNIKGHMQAIANSGKLLSELYKGKSSLVKAKAAAMIPEEKAELQKQINAYDEEIAKHKKDYDTYLSSIPQQRITYTNAQGDTVTTSYSDFFADINMYRIGETKKTGFRKSDVEDITINMGVFDPIAQELSSVFMNEGYTAGSKGIRMLSKDEFTNPKYLKNQLAAYQRTIGEVGEITPIISDNLYRVYTDSYKAGAVKAKKAQEAKKATKQKIQENQASAKKGGQMITALSEGAKNIAGLVQSKIPLGPATSIPTFPINQQREIQGNYKQVRASQKLTDSYFRDVFEPLFEGLPPEQQRENYEKIQNDPDIPHDVKRKQLTKIASYIEKYPTVYKYKGSQVTWEGLDYLKNEAQKNNNKKEYEGIQRLQAEIIRKTKGLAGAGGLRGHRRFNTDNFIKELKKFKQK